MLTYCVFYPLKFFRIHSFGVVLNEVGGVVLSGVVVELSMPVVVAAPVHGGVVGVASVEQLELSEGTGSPGHQAGLWVAQPSVLASTTTSPPAPATLLAPTALWHSLSPVPLCMAG